MVLAVLPELLNLKPQVRPEVQHLSGVTFLQQEVQEPPVSMVVTAALVEVVVLDTMPLEVEVAMDLTAAEVVAAKLALPNLLVMPMEVKGAMEVLTVVEAAEAPVIVQAATVAHQEPVVPEVLTVVMAAMLLPITTSQGMTGSMAPILKEWALILKEKV